MSDRIRRLAERYKIESYQNVVGYSEELQPRIRRGRVVPEERCLRVYVSRKVPEDRLPKDQVLPKEVSDSEGEVCVDVVEIGHLRKLGARYASKYRPTPCGVSTSRLDEVAAGTIGWWVVSEDFDYYLVSNNHVWAAENDGEPGDPLVQPGRLDGGTEADVFAHLAGFVPIDFGGDNYVDLAWATCDDPGLCYTALPEVGGIVGEAPSPSTGDKVVKVGRTTGLTEGVVSDASAVVRVGYDKGTARFVDVVLVTSDRAFCREGDSGSPVLAAGRLVGVLFGGNGNGTVCAVFKTGRMLEAMWLATNGRVHGVLVSNSPPPWVAEVREVVVYRTSPVADALALSTLLPLALMPLATLLRREGRPQAAQKGRPGRPVR